MRALWVFFSVLCLAPVAFSQTTPAACSWQGSCTAKAQCRKQGFPELQGEWALALSWHPGFCHSREDVKCLPDCQDAQEPAHFTLHGLWPQWAEYCGVSDDVAQCACSNARANLPAVAVGADLAVKMKDMFPDRWSLLERHEWTKHGTCSGMTQDAYFRTAIGMVDQVNASALGDLIRTKIGKMVTYGDLCDAAERTFGPAVRGALTVDHPNNMVHGRYLLTGLMITFKPKEGAFDLKGVDFVKVDPNQRTLGDRTPTLLCAPENLSRRLYIDPAGVE